MNRKTEYRQRIRALSREQQQQLAQRVDQTHQSERRKEKLTSNRNGLTYSPSTQHLIAYVVPEKNAKTLDSNALRSYLKARLSDAMLPAAFVQLPTLPRNANGKIDRKALPQVNKQFFNTNTVSAPPRNETESVLATIWSEALGLDSISIYDDFFELGGNSILNIQILSRIRDAGFDLHPSQFSAYSNIAELATLLNPTSVSEESTRTDVNINIYPYADRERELETHFPNPEIYRELQAIVAGRQGHRPKPSSLMTGLNMDGSKPPIFWCMNGWNGFFPIVRHLGSEQPIYGMESGYHVLRDRSSSETMSQSEFVELVCAIADHHVREIVELYPEGPYQLIGHSFGSVIAFSIAQKLQSEKGRVSFFGSIDTHGPHAPLYRALKPFETFYLDRLYNLRHFKSLSGTQRWEYFNSRMRQYLSSLLKPKKSISETAGIAHQYNDNETIENTASPNLSSPRSSSHLADIDVIEKLLTLNFETKIENLHVFLARQERTKYPWKHVLSPRAGWSTDSASEIRVHHCSGDHWQIVLEPHVRELAQKLVKAIAESS